MPEKAAEKYDREKYEIAIKKFRELTKERDRIETKAKKDDPAYARARDWFENEQAGATGQYRNLEKPFLEKLTEEQRSKYNQWKIAMPMLVIQENVELELKNHPASLRAYVFLYEGLLKGRPGIDRDESRVLPGDGDKEKLQNILSYNVDQAIEYQKKTDVSGIEQELRIPADLKKSYLDDYNNSAKHLLYTTYIYAHTPAELIELDKEVKISRAQLDEIRPGWQYAEGLWPDRNKPLSTAHSTRSWLNMTCPSENGQ